MPNFVKIPCQMKEFSIQALDSDRSVNMAAICYSGPISAVSTIEQFLSEKRADTKFQIDSLTTEGLVCIYTDGRTDRRTWLNQLSSSC